MSKRIWTDSELDALARDILFKYPGRGLDRVTQPHQIDLNDLEVTPLIQNAMPPHRQALRPKLNRLKRDLVPALIRVTGRGGLTVEAAAAVAHLQPVPEKPAMTSDPVPRPDPLAVPEQTPVEAVVAPQAPALPAPEPAAVAAAVADTEGDEDDATDETEAPGGRRKGNKQRQSKIRWSDDEWRFCALALHTMCPDLNLVEAKTMDGVTLRELNMAASMMEPGRQRHFKWLKGPAARLMQEYERARRDRDPFYYGNPVKVEAPVESVQVAALEPVPEPTPPLPPPAPAALAGNTPDPAPVVPSVATPKEKPAGATFSRVGEQRIFWSTAEWVEIALEIDRLHPHSKYIERNTTGALTVQDIMQAQRVLPQERRRQLRTALMDKLRVCLLDAFKEVKRMRAEASKAQHAQAVQAFEERRAAAAEPPPNPWETALRPLVELVVRELGAQLVPMIVQALASSQAQAAGAPPAHVSNVASLPGSIGRAPEPKPKKMRIGMVSGRSTYADDLDKTFPEVKFEYIESHNTRMVDSVKNCDRVILLTRFTSHPMQDRLKKAVGDRLILVNGSVTDAKRVIHGLLNTPERKTA
jgi:hypothetical protein